MKNTPVFIATLFGLVLLVSCDKSADNSSGAAITSQDPAIQTVNYPLAYFAERIAGDHAKVVFAAPADGDPAFWKPSDADLTNFQKADLIVLNGATYAKWLKTASLPGNRTVDTSAGFADQFITIKEAGSHSHGEGGNHSHTGTAYTTWIDFSLAKQQARAIADALSERLPSHAGNFTANAEKLSADLDALDSEMMAAAKQIGNQPLFGSHPIYQYWARRYQLNLVAVLWEPEVVPDTAALNALVKKSVDHDAKWMIWEGEPAAESVEKIKLRGISSVVFDPSGNRPEGGTDWLAVMRQNIANLKAIASPQ